MTITRYNFDKHAPGLFKHANGGWVKAKEHDLEVDRLRDIIRRATLNRTVEHELSFATPLLWDEMQKEANA